MLDLRKYFNSLFGVDVDSDLALDDDILQSWLSAIKFWQKYRLGEEHENFIDLSTGTPPVTYSFVSPNMIPKTISLYKLNVDAHQFQPIICGQALYIAPTLTAFVNGYFLVKYHCDYSDLANIDQSHIDKFLEELFFNYEKLKVGQYLKFADFGDHPYNLDGSAIFSEASENIEKIETKIRDNRDETFENITKNMKN